MHAFHASGSSYNHRLRVIFGSLRKEFGASFLDLCLLFIQLGHHRRKSTQKQLHNALIWHLSSERKYKQTAI